MPSLAQNSQNHPPFFPFPFLPPPPPNHFMSNTQTFSTVNSQSLQTFPSILANNPTMVSNDDIGLQYPQFSSQIRIQEIVVYEIEGFSIKGSLKSPFQFKKIHTLLVHDSISQLIQLLVLVKENKHFG